MWIIEQAHKAFSNLTRKIKNSSPGCYTDPDVIIRNYNTLYDHHNRECMINCSLIEDQENSWYAGILNTLSNHCVGTVPLPVPLGDNDKLNDSIEDNWREWAVSNKIGEAIRDMRRTAAQTGLAVAVPYRMEDTSYELRLGFKIVGQQHLKSPMDAFNNPLIQDGIEYWPSGDIRRVFIAEDDEIDPTPYDVPSEAFVWSRKRATCHWPECSPAFSVYPSIRRFLENVNRGEEMRSSMPMAVKLGTSYKVQNNAMPKGAFEYQPGMVMTLPPDTELQGLNWGAMAADRVKMLELMVLTAARCIDMPKNLAMASSSDSNMATAHIDLQPWKYVIDIDRFDFERFVRWTYKRWFSYASYLPSMDSSALIGPPPPTLFNYTVLFDHPDPAKRATARATDLISGASTLTRIYADQGLTARREIRKECKLLGITVKDFYKQLLASRSKQVAEVLYGTQTNGGQGQDTTK